MSDDARAPQAVPTTDQGDSAPPPATRPGEPGSFALQIRSLVSPQGLTGAAITAGVALGIGMISALLILIAAAVSSHSSVDVGTGILALLVGAGWTLGTGVTGSLEGAALFDVQLAAGVSAQALALGSLAAVVSVVAVIARLRAAADGTASARIRIMAARAAIEGAAIALLLTLITAIPAVVLGSGGTGLVLRSNGAGTFAVSTAALFLALTLGRMSARRPAGRPSWAGFGPALREAATLLIVFAVVFGTIALVGTVWYLTANGQGIAALAVLPFLGNAAGLLVSLAALGGLTITVSGAPATIIGAGNLLDGWGWLLPVLALVLLLVLAIRIGAHRGATAAVRWTRVWQLPVVAFAGWLLLSVALLIVVNADIAFFGGSGTIGVAWWTPFLGGLWAFALSIGAEFAPRFAAELTPGLFAALAGARGREAWAGGAVPASPVDAAAASGARQPLTAEQQAESGTGDAASGLSAAAPRPLSPAAKRGVIIGVSVLGGLAILTVAGFAAVGILNSTRGPDVAVRAYVDALAAGDATTAAELVDPGLPNDERLLLTDAALESAEHRLVVKSVKTIGTSDTSATVEAELSVDGEKFTHAFVVERGQNEFLVLNTWQVETPLLAQVAVGASAGDAVQVGGVEVPLGDGTDQPYGTVSVYPGTYVFTAPESTYVTSTPVTARIVGDGTGSGKIFVEQEPSDALRELVLKQAQERITACATVPTNIDDICPYPASSTDLASLSLKTQATKLTEMTPTEFQTDEATITTQGEEFFGYTPTPRDTSFALGGTIDFEGGEPVVTFTYAY